MAYRAIVVLAASIVLASSAYGSTEVKGVSLAHLHRRGFGYGSDECRQELAAIRATGANWVAINDYAYMEAVDRPGVRFGGDGSMHDADLAQVVTDAHAAGLKVLLKPHIWSREYSNEGKWNGDIRMTSEADWDKWFEQYTQYVMNNARIGAQTGAEAVCVGVEYEGTSQQEARWRKLIAEVRQVFPGHLTYAATFMEWKKIAFWDALDCIGIDAYWPVAQTAKADEAEVRRHWGQIHDELAPLAKRLGKPVCFLELGYSVSSNAGKEPWSYTIVDADEPYQAMLYRVALEEAAKRELVVGVFVWKWFTSDQFRRMEGRDPFAMQDRKLVLDVLREQWGGR
jgi:hypothetical protein